MTIEVKAFANADDILIAWEPATWSNDWVGFQLERRDETSQQVTVIANRIPPKPGGGPVQPTGISSILSPIRRCIWTDHSVVDSNNVSYRVTAMKNAAGGGFAPDAASASDWTAPTVATGEAGGGLTCYFNRGTLMSQIVSRFVNGDVSDASLRQFLVDLEKPGFNARRYLSGDILPNILKFLRDARSSRQRHPSRDLRNQRPRARRCAQAVRQARPCPGREWRCDQAVGGAGVDRGRP